MLARIHSAIRHFENYFVILIMLALVVVTNAQIILRNFFDSGLGWSDSLARVLVLWLTLAGALIATRERTHLGIDVLLQSIPLESRRWIETAIDLIAACVCGFVSWYALELVLLEKEDGLLAFARIPVWWCEVIIPFAFAAMGLRFFLHAIFSEPNISPQDHSPADEISGNAS